MGRESCIQQSARHIVLRENYLSLFDGDESIALLLDLFVSWTDRDLALAELDDSPGGLWISRSIDRLQEDLLGLYERERVIGAVAVLLDMGLLERHENHKDLYHLDVAAVQAALEAG